MAEKHIDPPRVAQFIEMCDFPADKSQLLLMADECEFPDDVMDVCEDLPNRTYECEEDVLSAVDEMAECPARE